VIFAVYQVNVKVQGGSHVSFLSSIAISLIVSLVSIYDIQSSTGGIIYALNTGPLYFEDMQAELLDAVDAPAMVIDHAIARDIRQC
jgi:hypothetical protein